jgi:hypothetical protein
MSGLLSNSNFENTIQSHDRDRQTDTCVNVCPHLPTGILFFIAVFVEESSNYTGASTFTLQKPQTEVQKAVNCAYLVISYIKTKLGFDMDKFS